jgi:hypothetical protein
MAIDPTRTSDGCKSLAPEPGVTCAGPLLDAPTPPFVLVWVDGLDVPEPGFEPGPDPDPDPDPGPGPEPGLEVGPEPGLGDAGDGGGEGVGVLVEVTPTLIVGTGAVAVATTTLWVTPCGVTVFVERSSVCAGWALQKSMKGWNSGST